MRKTKDSSIKNVLHHAVLLCGQSLPKTQDKDTTKKIADKLFEAIRDILFGIKALKMDHYLIIENEKFTDPMKINIISRLKLQDIEPALDCIAKKIIRAAKHAPILDELGGIVYTDPTQSVYIVRKK